MSSRKKIVRGAVCLLMTALFGLLALDAVRAWRRDAVVELEKRGVVLFDGRFAGLPVLLRDSAGVPLTSSDGAWPARGTAVYVECYDDSSQSHRLRRVGEVAGHGRVGANETVFLGVQPNDAAELFAESFEIRYYQFDWGGDAIKELLLSPERRRSLGRELTLLAEDKGHVVKEELGPILKKVVDDVEKYDGVAIKEVTVSEILAGWLGQDNPDPQAAAKKGIEQFITAAAKRLVEPRRVAELEDALGNIWLEIRHHEHRDANLGQAEDPRPIPVGLQDILERYFFVQVPEKGFSPEVTLLMRAVLYEPSAEVRDSPASLVSGGKAGAASDAYRSKSAWPPERWIVLRRQEGAPAPISPSAVREGTLWGRFQRDGRMKSR